MPTKLIIVDDHKVLLDSLETALNHKKDLEVIGTAADGKELFDLLRHQKPDVIVLDIEMPTMDGIEASKRLKKEYPKIKIIILTMYNTQVFVQLLISLGVNGYVLKNANTDELATAIKTVARGASFFGSGVPLSFEPKGKARITKGELRVLRLVAKGLNSPEIADELHLATTTVETHRKNMRNRLNARNSIELIRIAESMGYLLPGNFGEK